MKGSIIKPPLKRDIIFIAYNVLFCKKKSPQTITGREEIRMGVSYCGSNLFKASVMSIGKLIL